MKIELRKVSADEGRELWLQWFAGSEYPARTTKWFEVVREGHVLGWCAYRYLPKRAGRDASTLVTEGIYVNPASRGCNLQNIIRDAMVSHVRAPGSKRPILVQTYVNAENIASLRNCILYGMVPYKYFREGSNIFVNLEVAK